MPPQRGVVIWIASAHMSASIVKFNPLFHFPTFAIGILCARWQANRSLAVDSELSLRSVCICIAGAAIGIATILILLPVLPNDNLFDGLVTPIFICIVFALSRPGTWIFRVLSVGWLVVLGEVSYALDLIHAPVQHLFQLMKIMNRPIFYPVYLVTCLALSFLILYCFEIPSRRLLNKLFQTNTRKLDSVNAASK